MTGNNKQTALDLASGGFHVFPCHAGGDKAKQPMPFLKWREASTTDARQINAWWQRWPDSAIGLDLAKSGLVVIDADRHSEGSDGVGALTQIFNECGFMAIGVPMVNTPNAGKHYFFRQPAGKSYGNGDAGQYNGKKLRDMGINIRGHGGYVLAPGTVMADGREYELIGDFSSVPVLPDFFSAILDKSSTNVDKGSVNYTFPTYRADDHETPIEEIEELLTYVSASCPYSEWVEVLMGIHAFTGGSQEGFLLADKWSAGGAKYKGSAEIAAKWRSFKSGGVTSGTIAKYAQDGGADLSAIRIKHMRFEQYDEVQAKMVSDMIKASFERRERAETGAKSYQEQDDGVLVDIDTGQAVGVDLPLPATIEQPSAPIVYPPGLVGRIARFIVSVSPKQQPGLAIGAALSLVGVMAGRQYLGPIGNSTALYTLGLAPTGAGKDIHFELIGKIMKGVGRECHFGPGGFSSHQALVKTILETPLCLSAIDEFGDFLRGVFSTRSGAHLQGIARILRTLWTIGTKDFSPDAKVDRSNVLICQPWFGIFSASTHSQFYSALAGGAIADGTLNRFLIIDGDKTPAYRRPERSKTDIPADIISDLKIIYYRFGDLQTAMLNDHGVNFSDRGMCRTIDWAADGAEQAYEAFVKENERVAGSDPRLEDLVVRSSEMAVRIATTIAIGRLDGDRVRREDIEFGIDMARRSARIMADGIDDYMAENQYQADYQKILRKIKERAWQTRRDIGRAVGSSVQYRVIDDVIKAMVTNGIIEEAEVNHKGSGRKTMKYRFIKQTR